MVRRAAGLSERESAVLRALIEAHVEIGAPIGSEWLARREGWVLSSATIRTVLAGLEESGYLRQPHTSAGRVPTEKGYRAYVAHRLRDGGFADEAELAEELPEEMEALLSEGDCEEILGQLAQVIGQVTHQLGLVLAPGSRPGSSIAWSWSGWPRGGSCWWSPSSAASSAAWCSRWMPQSRPTSWTGWPAGSTSGCTA
ncbi:MAG: hypothetical protein WDA75_24035 [Candidatus Latescibacterota bacterium]|jgi:transcriptional regulator of heat shock response